VLTFPAFLVLPHLASLLNDSVKKHFVAFHLSALDSGTSQRAQVSGISLFQPLFFLLASITAAVILSYSVLAKTGLTSLLGAEG